MAQGRCVSEWVPCAVCAQSGTTGWAGAMLLSGAPTKRMSMRAMSAESRTTAMPNNADAPDDKRFKYILNRFIRGNKRQ